MYNIYDILYYDRTVMTELNKQHFVLYTTPRWIYDDEIEDYRLIDDVFSDEKEIYNSIFLGEFIKKPDTQKFKDYEYLMSLYMKEYENTEITIDSAIADISFSGRTEMVSQLEDFREPPIRRNFIWVDGAEDISGCIKQKTGVKDLFIYINELEDGSLFSQDLNLYNDGDIRPYYTQNDGYTYIWVDHFSGGSGTQLDPYIISNRTDFENIKNDTSAYYKQDRDIDFGGSSNPWDLVSPRNFIFRGEYDGDGHTISNVYGLRTGTATTDRLSMFYGFFSGALIKNTKFDNIYFDTNASSCCIVSTITSSSGVENTHVKNSNFSSATECSALYINLSSNTLISRCSVTDSVITTKNTTRSIGASALCAATDNSNNTGIFEENYSYNNFINGEICGGLIGRSLNGEAVIRNNYCEGGRIGDSGTVYSGGLIGTISEDDGSVISLYNNFTATLLTGTNKRLDANDLSTAPKTSCSDNFGDENVCGVSVFDGFGMTNKTTAQMKTQSTFTNWNFSTVWSITSSYPFLQNNGLPIPPDPTTIAGYIAFQGLFIPYYNFADFGVGPVAVYKNAAGNVFGFMEDANSKVLLGPSLRLKTVDTIDTTETET